jgi:hypothetical protein
MRLRYQDEMTGERIANFRIGRDMHEVLHSDDCYYGAQCENCGDAVLTVDMANMNGLVAKLTCDGCKTEYFEVIDNGEQAMRAMKELGLTLRLED